MIGYEEKIKRMQAAGDQMEVYQDANYAYSCLAAPGTALSAKSWRIIRTNKTSGQVRFPVLNGISDNDYHFSAADLSVVSAYDYDIPQ